VAENEERQIGRYSALIERLFLDRYSEGATELEFEREDLVTAANKLGLELPKNLGDVVYSVRYRTPMPETVRATQPDGMEWIIEGAGRAKYVFRLAPTNRIAPNPNLVATKIPNATPDIISAYALSDEQALLAKVRYNRLIDIFLGITSYSLQNHLRTTVTSVGQIEIDELYVGVDRLGRQYVVPVQAKGGRDQISAVQTKQDIACCRGRFPQLIVRAVSTQFMSDELIALFEFALNGERIEIVDERHYRLVPADDITAEDLQRYRNGAS